ALHRQGVANQPHSVDRFDGLKLRDCYITAAIHCAPPGNKPLPEEFKNYRPYLLEEVALLNRVRVVVALARIAFDPEAAGYGQPATETGYRARRCAFGHGSDGELDGQRTLLASFHPSQQNPFTGKLTEAMFDSICERARELVGQ